MENKYKSEYVSDECENEKLIDQNKKSQIYNLSANDISNISEFSLKII